MNKLEKLVYDFVKTNPGLKNKLRNIYQGVLGVVPVKKLQSQYPILTREGYFFGFHDKSPWSPDNTKLLAHQYTIPNRLPQKCEKAPIGFFHGQDYREFQEVSSTQAWNYQQGSMLQWLNNDQIIFNDIQDNRAVAKIVDTAGNIVKTLSNPIGAVSPDGKFAATYSFERLGKAMPGYGYAVGDDPTVNHPTTEDSGLSLIDLETNEAKQLYSVQQIADIKTNPSMEGAYHFFTHCLFSPGSQRLLFLHRWKHSHHRLQTRLMACDLDGDNLHVLPATEMVSHFGWRNDSEVIAFAHTTQYGDKYYLFTDQQDTIKVIGEDFFQSDGHPQFTSTGDRFVTDTYANRFRLQSLLTYDMQEQQGEVLAKLHSPAAFREEIRCDLHPRWDRTGTIICFDSVHTGKRAICTINTEQKAEDRE